MFAAAQPATRWIRAGVGAARISSRPCEARTGTLQNRSRSALSSWASPSTATRRPSSRPTRSAGEPAAPDPTRVEHHHLVGQRRGLLGLVRGEQDRGACVAQLADELPNDQPGLRVQPGGRLVQQQEQRLPDQRGGEGETLAFATGQPAHRGTEHGTQAQPVDQLVEVPGPGVQGGDLAEHPSGGGRQRQATVLEHHADPGAQPRIRRGVAEHVEHALVGSAQADGALDERRLARTVRAEQGGELALGEGEVDPGERFVPPVPDHQAGRDEAHPRESRACASREGGVRHAFVAGNDFGNEDVANAGGPHCRRPPVDRHGGEMTETTESESSTRDRILHLVVEAGPVSVLDLAHDLHLTPAGVRRHVAALEEAGQVAVHTSRTGSAAGRGRPARRYVATVRAQATLDCSYADIAQEALGYLAQVAGEPAVEAFAEHRASRLQEAIVVDLAATDLRSRTAELAAALSGQGYAASVRQVPGGRAVQLCQGHCPVRDVAVGHPELCEAETRMISRVLGVHVQRLSTLAAGAHVCTTHVPVSVLPNARTAAPATTLPTTDRPTAPDRHPAAVEGER